MIKNLIVKGPDGKGLDTSYSTTYMSQTRDQQRFTISEVAADWHEPMVPQRIMWPSIARANGQLDPRCSCQTHHRPNQPHQAFTPQLQLLLISRPAEGRRLSWPSVNVNFTKLQFTKSYQNSIINTCKLYYYFNPYYRFCIFKSVTSVFVQN